MAAETTSAAAPDPPDEPLAEYRRKRSPTRTPEPVPTVSSRPRSTGADNSYVVQEHHATALHWDFRLERDGVLVSWAVPKGLPTDPKRNHLAVQTEDHPLDYAGFEGQIGQGEYGGGVVKIWDRGTYELEKWSDREVKFTLRGERTQGQFVLIRTGGKNWIMHRMGGAAKPDWDQQPATVAPMLATLGQLPSPHDDSQWAYEMKWDGVRAVCTVDGGRIALASRNEKNITASYPELRALGASLGATQVILDGEIVAFDQDGRTSFSLLQQRMHVAEP
ncbi:MAG: ligase, partial [Pseudonocardiales bacterium]|nr:ligase [Pseudonocardiales bacterium]